MFSGFESGYLPQTRNRRNDFSGLERVQGAEAAVEFGAAYAAFAEGPAEKLLGGALLLFRVAIVAETAKPEPYYDV